MELSKSIFGLAKNNNGFFKSEKQAQFLISVLEERGGHIGQANSGYNQCSMFATWDEKGIIEITKHRTGGKIEVMFQRKLEGVLTVTELKHIKSLKKRIKDLEKSIVDRELFFIGKEYSLSFHKMHIKQLATVNKFKKSVSKLEGNLEESLVFEKEEEKFNSILSELENKEINDKIIELENSLVELENSFPISMEKAKLNGVEDIVESFYNEKIETLKNEIVDLKNQIK